jgi:diguanylate cyclase (GGDEF)-like protein
MYLIGILQALGIVFIDTLYNLYIKFTGVNFEIKAFIFPFYYLIGNALTLMVLAGPGRFALDTIKNISTWVYGIAYLSSFIVEIYLVKYVSSTELSILLRLTVPVCIILAFIYNKRKPVKSDLIVLFTIFSTVAVILSFQETSNLMNIIYLCLMLALLEALGFFIPENHSTNEKAIKESGIRGQMRVISFATFITTIILFFALIIFTVLDKHLNISQAVGLQNNLIKLDDFIHLPTVLSGLVFGLILAPFVRYFQWSASYKITSESVLSIMAIIPLITFSLEYLLVHFKLMPSSPLFESGHQEVLFALAIFMAVGSWFSAFLKSKGKLKVVEGKNIFEKIKNSLKLKENVLNIGYSITSMQDYEVIKITVDFYEKDFKHASAQLEIPEETIKTLYYGEKSYSLSPEYSKKVHKIFRNKIFYLDQLTKLENRRGFETYFDELHSKNTDFSVYYMDLNGFKKINDTYGHNVGDEVLIGVAAQMVRYIKNKKAKAFRFGGDEFALIIEQQTNDDTIKTEVRNTIEQPIIIKQSDKIKEITPRISIGKSNIIKGEDVKIKDILELADKEMYEEKESLKV